MVSGGKDAVLRLYDIKVGRVSFFDCLSSEDFLIIQNKFGINVRKNQEFST